MITQYIRTLEGLGNNSRATTPEHQESNKENAFPHEHDNKMLIVFIIAQQGRPILAQIIHRAGPINCSLFSV